MPLPRQAIWGHIWKHTVEKNQTNATNATMQPLRQATWRDIWKHTVEKSPTNATSVSMRPFRQAIWRHIWKHTVEKSQTNATSVTMQLLRQEIWSGIWKSTLETKANKCNQCGNAFSQKRNLKRHLKTHTGKISKKWKWYDFAPIASKCMKLAKKIIFLLTNCSS